MKRLMKHTETLVKRCLVPFLTLTLMLTMLVLPAVASHSPRELGVRDEMLAGETNLPGDSGTCIQSEVYKLFGDKEMEGEDGILISPTGTGDKPGDSGGGSKGGSFWIYRLFGANDVNETRDEMLAGLTDLQGDSGKPIQSEVYNLYEAQKMEGADGVLISPVIKKPPDSIIKDNGFWIYRLFGANDVMDAWEKCWWRVAVPKVKA